MIGMGGVPYIEAVEGFFEVFQMERAVETERLKALSSALDALALAYTGGTDEALDERQWPEPPVLNSYEHMRAVAAKSFPSFGFYPVTTPDENFGQETTAGDAIDDLADIANDLEVVVWRWKSTSARDAEWHFRFGYVSHWGRHLRDLQSYVHYQLFER